ncbi:hypothetical protein LINGRAHAP2_LOCUS24358 [Linum grandiflorum]
MGFGRDGRIMEGEGIVGIEWYRSNTLLPCTVQTLFPFTLHPRVRHCCWVRTKNKIGAMGVEGPVDDDEEVGLEMEEEEGPDPGGSSWAYEIGTYYGNKP